jgi:hypothetical protein
MQQLTAQNDTRPCLICSKQGTRQAVEVLPDGGILFMVAHDNGQICRWAEYASIFDVTNPNKKKGKRPTYIKCPNCGESGRLNWTYDLNAIKEERPFTFKYIIVHETLPGSWGKTKIKKRRRCQSFTPEQRIEILKQTGRYISDPPKPSTSLKKPDRGIRLPLQKITNNQDLTASNDNVPKKGNTDTKMEEALTQAEQENSRSQANQEIGSQYKDIVPRHKRLTICPKCNKLGYKYKTYFQHSNESPIGKLILKGKEIGNRYRRCSLTTKKVKQDNMNSNANLDSNQRDKSQIDSILRTDSILRDLDRHIEDSRLTLSKEDETGKDYKKMYWGLIEKLSKILYDTKTSTFL